MTTAYISDLKQHVGETVSVRGWIFNRRGKGKLIFLILRDGTGLLQTVAFKKEVDEAVFEKAKSLPYESSVIVTGEVREDERSPGGVEMGLKEIAVVQEVTEEYPLQITDDVPDVGFLMNHRHLWLRGKRQAAVLRIRSRVVKAIRDFFDERGFYCCDAPILTPAACEGTSTLFGLEYFEEGEAYLTQSGQLYGEAMAMALGKIYVFGPTFRAEKSKTRKHLTEFWMVEPEVAYYELDDVMKLAEEFVSYIVQTVIERCPEDLKALDRNAEDLKKIIPPFPRISYTEAVDRLKESGHEFTWGDDLGAPQETEIGSWFDKPVMIHRYPTECKAFYMQPDPDDPKVAKCVDMIAPDGYGEIIGGSERIADYDLLLKRIEEHDLPRESFEWYLDLRRFGSVPHGGFGLGVERTVAWICGIEHVRETIPFPRMLYRIYP